MVSENTHTHIRGTRPPGRFRLGGYPGTSLAGCADCGCARAHAALNKRSLVHSR